MNNNACEYHMPFNKNEKIVEFPTSQAQKDADTIYATVGFSLIIVIGKNGSYGFPESNDNTDYFLNKYKGKSKMISIDSIMDSSQNINDILTAMTTRQDRSCYNESAFLYAKIFNERMMEIIIKGKN